MGSDERHFNVLLIVRDKLTRPCPQTTAFEEKGEQQRIRTTPTVSRSPAWLGLFSRNGVDSRVVQAEFNCGILIGWSCSDDWQPGGRSLWSFYLSPKRPWPFASVKSLWWVICNGFTDWLLNSSTIPARRWVHSTVPGNGCERHWHSTGPNDTVVERGVNDIEGLVPNSIALFRSDHPQPPNLWEMRLAMFHSPSPPPSFPLPPFPPTPSSTRPHTCDWFAVVLVRKKEAYYCIRRDNGKTLMINLECWWERCFFSSFFLSLLLLLLIRLCWCLLLLAMAGTVHMCVCA